VAAYIEPSQFDAWREYGLSIGFKMVFSGPLVRSSYMADHVNQASQVSEEARRTAN
jgi:lipoic acid synthetase